MVEPKKISQVFENTTEKGLYSYFQKIKEKVNKSLAPLIADGIITYFEFLPEVGYFTVKWSEDIVMDEKMDGLRILLKGATTVRKSNGEPVVIPPVLGGVFGNNN